MKTCCTCKISKSLENYSKNKNRKDGIAAECRNCNNIRSKTWGQKNSEIVYLRNLEWRKNNRAKDRLNKRKWKLNNLDKHAAKEAERRAQKLNATPPWLNEIHLKEIENIYKSAKTKTKNSGIKYEVDHIIPLKGKNVSGLHVPWNLQIITSLENRVKSNNYG